MSNASMWILVLLTGGPVIALVSALWRQRRRRIQLARLAHSVGMQFSPDDPFDLPRRYGDFVVCSAGHSSRAENVVYGRRDGLYVRSFDFRFEVGHGAGRLVRRYSVLAIDTDLDLPGCLFWHERDNEHVPVEVGLLRDRWGSWLMRGSPTDRRLADCLTTGSDEPLDVQVSRRTVLVHSPRRWRPEEFIAWMQRAAPCVVALGNSVAPAGPSPSSR